MRRRGKDQYLVADKRMERHAGEGLENVGIGDRDFWSNEDDTRWSRAFEAIDARHDKGPLLQLLRSSSPMSSATREHLARLLERHDLEPVHRGRGRPPTLSYDRTPERALRLLAMEQVKERLATEQVKERPAQAKSTSEDTKQSARDKAIEDTILSLAGKSTELKGLERDEALVAAAVAHGITFDALFEDLNRGPRPKPKTQKTAPR